MQQSFLPRLSTKSGTATMASFKVVEILLNHEKPLEDGEIWKENFIKAGELLFSNKSEMLNSIKEMSLSRTTVMCRTEVVSTIRW